MARRSLNLKLWWHLKGNTEQLEGLAVCLRRMPGDALERDVEEVLRDEDGNLLLSRSTISKLSEKLLRKNMRNFA
jgi:hypothetical protein